MGRNPPNVFGGQQDMTKTKMSLGKAMALFLLQMLKQAAKATPKVRLLQATVSQAVC